MNSSQTEQALKELQDQFLQFREEKRLKEGKLKAQIERLKHDLDTGKRQHEKEIQ
jgi:hypothetical protein